MRRDDDLERWLLGNYRARSAAQAEQWQANNHESLNKLESFLDNPPPKKVNMADYTGIWGYWYSTPLPVTDLDRAQALYYRVVMKGGPGSQIVQEGLLGMIAATDDPDSIPFWLALLDFDSLRDAGKKRDNFRRQRWIFGLAALARLAVQWDEPSIYEPLVGVTRHPNPEIRERAVEYLGQCYLMTRRALPPDLVELLNDVATQDSAFAARYHARSMLRQADLPVPVDYPDGVYVFTIWFTWAKDISRTIEVKSSQTLADLQVAFQRAIDWDNDHFYAFFMNGDEGDRRFAITGADIEMFDMEDDDVQLQADKVAIGSLGLSLGHRFLYLFDYGDQHLFEVELTALRNEPYPNGPTRHYPHLVVSQGDAPPQYPDWKDYELWE